MDPATEVPSAPTNVATSMEVDLAPDEESSHEGAESPDEGPETDVAGDDVGQAAVPVGSYPASGERSAPSELSADDCEDEADIRTQRGSDESDLTPLSPSPPEDLQRSVQDASLSAQNFTFPQFCTGNVDMKSASLRGQLFAPNLVS